MYPSFSYIIIVIKVLTDAGYNLICYGQFSELDKIKKDEDLERVDASGNYCTINYTCLVLIENWPRQNLSIQALYLLAESQGLRWF